MRPITAEGFVPVAASARLNPGDKPGMRWIAIADLVVDESYQRPIYGAGRSNVRKIAAAFHWSCFAPVIVSPVRNNKFAIIDGQHRTTAAMLVGVDKVPCQVVSASGREQARAFQAINGLTTKMTRQAVHAAAVVAGDQAALEIEDVCKRAGVEILRYPIAANLQTKPGQTMAVGCLADCLRVFGRDTLITALQCITETENNVPGVLGSAVIRALCDMLARRKDWRDSGSALLEALDLVDVSDAVAAIWGAPRKSGVTAAMALGQRLEELVGAEIKLKPKAK